MATHVTGTAAPAAAPGMFVRNATGLVREVKPWQAMAINFITGAPPFVIGIALFGALAGFPGGSFLLAALLTIPFALCVVYAFGFMTAAMPRSGGDYVIVSRTLHPALGTVSSACISLSSFLSIAFEALAFVTLAVAPGLITIGLVGGHHRLVSWGTTVASSQNWQFGLGCGAIVAAGIAVGAGWTWAKRFMFTLLGFSLFGLVVVALIALFAGKHSFIGNFNSFARPYTHNPDTYHATIAAVPRSVSHPAFSFAKTINVIAVIASISIYAYWSTFFAGELRQGNTLKTANRMGAASMAILVSVIVFVAIFFFGFGKDFLTAANGGGLPSQLGSSAAYFFLSSAYVNNTAFAIFVVLSFVLFWPVIIAETALQPPRTLFAWSFDGIMPKSVASVTNRGVPLIATTITIAGSIGAFAWAVYAAKSHLFQVIAYATLAQLITHALIGVSAIAFPYRHKSLYQASVAAKEVAGIPLSVIAGIGAILVSVFLYYEIFTNKAFFVLQANRNLAYWLGGTVAFGLLWYLGARYVRRQEGIDIDRVYAEIPPE